MLRLLMLLLALLLSQGWQWSRLLEEHHLLTGDQGIFVAIVFIGLFVLQQSLLQIRTPAERTAVRDRSAVVEVFLRQLSVEYYKVLDRKFGQDVFKPITRINVMLPVVSWFGLRKRLQICYKSCPDGIQFSNEELDLYWTAKHGVVGWVWSRGEPQVYGASRTECRALAESMNDRQSGATARLRSVIGVPILLNGKPIAVLTLDSLEDLDQTRFDCEEIQSLAHSFAAKLPSQCYPQGVKPR